MGTQITVTQGDYGYNINFTLQTSTGAIFDLTGASGLKFRTQLVGSITLNSSGAMAIDNATAGTCHYTVASTDFTTAGVYNAQIQVTFAAEVITFSNLQVEVLPKVPF